MKRAAAFKATKFPIQLGQIIELASTILTHERNSRLPVWVLAALQPFPITRMGTKPLIRFGRNDKE